MKLALVGVGAAGSRIVDRIVEMEKDTARSLCHGNVLAFDILPQPSEDLEYVPEGHRVAIGDMHPAVDADGTDRDPDLAVTIAENNLPEVRRAFDEIELHEVDGVLVISGLGGGTGGGMGALTVEELQAIADCPVYALGVLPHKDEGGQMALNAARAIRSVVPTATNTLLFDNDAWQVGGDADPVDYERSNRELATRVLTLLAAGELDTESVAETAMDSSDIIRTLEPGGVSAIGYASTEIEQGGDGLLSRLLAWFNGDAEAEPRQRTTAARTNDLVRQAVNGRLTLPCDPSSAERALVILSGPPEEFSRRGFERARQWLEQEADTVEVLAGDDPRRGSSTLAAAVLLSNVTEVPRIEFMQEQATHTKRLQAEGVPPTEGED